MSTGINKSLALLLCLTIFSHTNIPAQGEDPWSFELGGYAKFLQTAYFYDIGPLDEMQIDNLIHQRLETTIQYKGPWTLHAALRTRLFYGEFVKSQQPNYADFIQNATDDYFHWSAILLDKEFAVLHTTVDRGYLRYSKDQWEITLGRQRINWGISTLWNPNDLYNTYSFTDFDYEERPGSDAIRIRRYMGFASGMELAVKAFDTWDEAVIAAKYNGHVGSYDYQVLSGYYRGDIPVGIGWAGNVGQAGWKGEATAFFPTEGAQDFGLTATTAIDYTFSSGWYILGGLLYNHSGETETPILQLFEFHPSARNIYPYTFGVAAQSSYNISPLWNASLLTIYSPVEVHPLFLNPQVTYSMAQNWDFDLIGQIIFNDQSGFESPLQLLFLRVKFSF